MAEPSTESAVVDRTSDLQQQVGPASRPSHLLGLVHTTIDQEVRCAFRNRSPDAQAGTISFGVIDEPAALVAEIIVDLVQRAPQLAGWDARRAMATLAFEDMQNLVGPFDGEAGIAGLAVPDTPASALDLLDDDGLRLHPSCP